MGIQPYRCECHSHAPTLNLCIYNVAESYVRVKLFMRRPRPRAHLAVLSHGLPGGKRAVHLVPWPPGLVLYGSIGKEPIPGLVKSDFVDVQCELPGWACH
jgi:hypothetical protein